MSSSAGSPALSKASFTDLVKSSVMAIGISGSLSDESPLVAASNS
jgi:hypothetical protein